ncbi:MAG: hypothetical protein HY901_18015 [Deltaproteobacteria bacterium]|nr:hypothetical protein [Deltaproteobacteria bacterium]
MRDMLVAVLLVAALGCGENVTPASSYPPGERNPPPGHDPYQAIPAGALACTPNLDEQIDSTELSVALGASAWYLVSPAGAQRNVNLSGSSESGQQTWDWGTDLAEDQLAQLSPHALSGRWYAAHFPKGQFAVAFDAAGTLESVSSQDEEGLWLHGLASTESDPPEGRTLLVYDSPILVLRYPVVKGSAWSWTGRVRNGVLRGFPWAQIDRYDVKVDAVGRLILPDLDFSQVFRVRTTVTATPVMGAPVVQRQTSFMAECFGEIARATSEVGEARDEFTVASEVRRLGL